MAFDDILVVGPALAAGPGPHELGHALEDFVGLAQGLGCKFAHIILYE